MAQVNRDFIKPTVSINGLLGHFVSFLRGEGVTVDPVDYRNQNTVSARFSDGREGYKLVIYSPKLNQSLFEAEDRDDRTIIIAYPQEQQYFIIPADDRPINAAEKILNGRIDGLGGDQWHGQLLT